MFVPPRPHELLSTYYRAADVCLVPSRSESFGLVALEAAACGTPVVASDVGGLAQPRSTTAAPAYLVEEPHPRGLRRLGPPDPGRAAAGRAAQHRAVMRARRYTWARAAHLLRRSTTSSPPGGSSSARDRPWRGILRS